MNEYSASQLSELYGSILPSAGNLVIKAGTNVVTHPETLHPNPRRIEDLVAQAVKLYKQGKKVTIVTSGAIGAGKAAAKVKDDYDPDLADRQALASIGQVKLMRLYDAYFARYGMNAGQFMASRDDMVDEVHARNFLNTVERLYRFNGLAVINENDPFSTEEITTENGYMRGTITFGDNDRLSVMAAIVLNAKILFYLSNEEGLMDYGSGRKINVIDDIKNARKFVTNGKSRGGTGGMAARLQSVEEALNAGITVVLLSGLQDQTVLRATGGEPIGTLFLPKNFKYTAQGD